MSDSTPIPEGFKRCRSCRELLPLSQFHKGYAKCRQCYSIHCGHTPKTREIYPDGYRRCTKCHELKPATNEYFYSEKRSTLGLRSACKSCLDKSSAEYHSAHYEAIRTYLREYRLTYIRKRYKADPDKKRLSVQKARKNNPAIYLAAMHRRLARKRNLPDAFTTADWQRALDYFKGCCAVCGRPPGLWHTLAADHWIPLSSPSCPGTVPSNIIPLCHGQDGCNNSKSFKTPEQWLVEKFGKRKSKQILERIRVYQETLK